MFFAELYHNVYVYVLKLLKLLSWDFIKKILLILWKESEIHKQEI